VHFCGIGPCSDLLTEERALLGRGSRSFYTFLSFGTFKYYCKDRPATKPGVVTVTSRRDREKDWGKIMTKKQINKAESPLIKFFQETNKAVLESALAAQEQNTKYVQNFFMGWLEALKSQAESNLTLMQGADQQTQSQLEALHEMMHKSVDLYFNFIRTPLSSYQQSFYLNEKLQICLLALDSRYPRNIVDINEEVLGSQNFRTDGWTALDVIELLQSSAPPVLQEKARLAVDSMSKGIYLIERSEEIPAIWIHLGGLGEKMPSYKGKNAK
jgi:hypothetical protein